MNLGRAFWLFAAVASGTANAQAPAKTNGHEKESSTDPLKHLRDAFEDVFSLPDLKGEGKGGLEGQKDLPIEFGSFDLQKMKLPPLPLGSKDADGLGLKFGELGKLMDLFPKKKPQDDGGDGGSPPPGDVVITATATLERDETGQVQGSVGDTTVLIETGGENLGLSTSSVEVVDPQTNEMVVVDVVVQRGEGTLSVNLGGTASSLLVDEPSPCTFTVRFLNTLSVDVTYTAPTTSRRRLQAAQNTVQYAFAVEQITGEGTCPSDQLTFCEGVNVCVDVLINPNFCGDCSTSCVSGQFCSGGTCGCPAGLTTCPSGCTDTDTDPDNCGACGNVCSGPTPLCSGGTCVNDCTTGGLTGCGGVCKDLSSDLENCGTCGTVCSDPSRQICTGTCDCQAPFATVRGWGVWWWGGACGVDEIVCDNVCESSVMDPNCGTCGNDCSAIGQVCGSGGTCECGFTLCPGNVCTDTDIDDQNCGACGNDCTATGRTCDGSGVCECLGDVCPGDLCTDLNTDEQNCGTCGNVCGAGATCSAGNCAFIVNVSPRLELGLNGLITATVGSESFVIASPRNPSGPPEPVWFRPIAQDTRRDGFFNVNALVSSPFTSTTFKRDAIEQKGTGTITADFASLTNNPSAVFLTVVDAPEGTFAFDSNFLSLEAGTCTGLSPLTPASVEVTSAQALCTFTVGFPSLGSLDSTFTPASTQIIVTYVLSLQFEGTSQVTCPSEVFSTFCSSVELLSGGTGDACVDTTSDPDNCNACGTSCPTGARCRNSAGAASRSRSIP
uniref:4Fe-4S ferredoxin-type domain-containing protein n=1 Tax=Chromera velia CCMP2878 TaxID=1169474 RepID=A0A0G4I5M1_9ALVE|eukprot:Cvel_11136.t1-p1 / transcript=Cvel_11136.t1 / gene=Cvel_11136 / organism=Chromera_velia_CCMP2878 / gene_product=Keratin-associated protein 5-5, putative / transcript_product=Keratin-associated protein 5-5, putative / location=Cvel_scaffold690:31691-39454(-) / protein_length=779 / sequence_SO=supercontig / SO=protein_coding / is_pseudo=false